MLGSVVLSTGAPQSAPGAYALRRVPPFGVCFYASYRDRTRVK